MSRTEIDIDEFTSKLDKELVKMELEGKSLKKSHLLVTATVLNGRCYFVLKNQLKCEKKCTKIEFTKV